MLPVPRQRLLVFGLTVVTLSGFGLAGWSADGALPGPRDIRQVFVALGETDRVSARVETTNDLFRFNQALTNDVIENRLGLWDAAARLLVANREAPGQWVTLERWFPGPTPEATAAANLIVRVHDNLNHDPARRQPLVRRLLADYRAKYGAPHPEWHRHVIGDELVPNNRPAHPPTD